MIQKFGFLIMFDFGGSKGTFSRRKRRIPKKKKKFSEIYEIQSNKTVQMKRCIKPLYLAALRIATRSDGHEKNQKIFVYAHEHFGAKFESLR